MTTLKLSSRARERGELLPHPDKERTSTATMFRKNMSPLVTVSKGIVQVPFSTGKTMFDIVHPRFRERQALGQIFNDPMHMSEVRVTFHPHSGLIYKTIATDQNGPTGSSLGTDVAVTAYIPSIADFPIKPPYMETHEKLAQAVNSAFAKAHQRYVNFLTDVAEASQTASLVKGRLASLDRMLNNALTEKEARASYKALDKATKLGGYPHSMSRRAYRQVLNAGKILEHTPVSRAARIATKMAAVSTDAVSAWLETRYGVIPLLGSISGLVDVLVEQSRPKRETFRGTSRSSDSNTYVSKVENVSGVTGLTRTYTIERSQWVKTRAGVLTEFHPNSLGGKLGTQLRDIPRTLYDLIPLSFVVDWAFNIGDYIEAIVPVPGFDWLASWVTSERTTETVYTYAQSGASRVISGTGGYTETWYPYTCSMTVVEKTKFRRTRVIPSLPTPDFTPVSTTHILDSVALAFQGFTRTRVK